MGGTEKSGYKLVMEEHPLPVAHSTLANRRPLHSEDEPPSVETASRLRKERQEELAMVCSVLDRSNPWRVASMRQPQKRALKQDGQESECVEQSPEGSDGSLDVSDERCISSLEVRLRRSCDSGEGFFSSFCGERLLSFTILIDTYRTLRRNIQGEPTAQQKADQKPLPKIQDVADVPVDLKEKIKLLSKEVSSLQRIIEQSCCALSYCVDAEHGKGTRQEAEAERLLLLSCEKKKALLKELERLRGGRSEQPTSPIVEMRPCSGSVTISDIRLPLKVDYVCSTFLETGPTGHYFLILIRYGAYDVVATPLASASDAQTGDTIIFPTTLTLKDASSDFKIEVEVYSLITFRRSRTLKNILAPSRLRTTKQNTTSSSFFPKMLGSYRCFLTTACSPAVNTPIRSSNFLLVGSLTLTLESLGKLKFTLEKVPFLSPLEGNLYLKVQCQSHSNVQRSGFLTMFEDVSGLGAWHRRWCVLSGNTLSFWAYPDQEHCKEPLGRINLINCTSAKVEAAMRESCARPHTLELVTMRPQREDDIDTLVTQCRNTLCFTKSWLSADTKEEKHLWMDSLNQVLLDLRTWKTSPGRMTSSHHAAQPYTS
ncbi:hypothetical protein GDO81_015620 [Engystomops pustulosus]|uniref:Anillin n=1 Tax=Engystomops pustulosus TaxID=76066 RepID=A0AAV7AN92_ENGPU|nr:hypothetical protein GDO81_015620 [Engystomops pustulosus]